MPQTAPSPGNAPRAATSGATEDQIARVRRFNRFYTRMIGLLNEGLLDSEFSLTEVRIFYELAHRDGLTAARLAEDLALDRGYLSRMLKKFEARGLLTRARSRSDARQSVLTLTDAGRTTFAPLEKASEDQVAALLAPLSSEQRTTLVGAMQAIECLLGDRPPAAVPYILRPLQTGDIGWISHRHGILYALEHGWDETFEALVAEIAGSFVRDHDPRRERCWIAERDGAVVGSIFLVRESDEAAKLRLLYVEPSARGLGIGSRLVRECVGFARAKGYKRITLWTNDVLVSARRIYETNGFRLVAEEAHHSFGKDLVGQYWELTL